MIILFSWDKIEHLAAKQIECLLNASDEISLIVVTQIVQKDALVTNVLSMKRIISVEIMPHAQHFFGKILYYLKWLYIFFRYDFDLIDVKMAHSQEAKVSTFLARIFDKKLILNILGKERHVFEKDFFKKRVRKSIINVIKKADFLVCVDQTLVETARKIRKEDTNLLKLWNSHQVIDINKIDSADIRKKYNIKKESLVVLFNHRIIKQKRPEIFLKAVKEILTRNNNNIVFIIVSTEKNVEIISKIINIKKQFPDNLIWLGRKRRLNFQEMKELYAISDIGVNIAELVVPSLATLEAMATGIPQIISDELDSDAYVEDGINGFIIDGQNSNELSEKILFLSKNPDIRKQMSEKCIEKVRNDFSPTEWGNKMIEVYKSLLS